MSSSGSVPAIDALADFSLEGRFSLQYEDKNASGRLNWRHVGMNDDVLLSSPFGQGLAEIVSTPQGARLTLSNGKVYEAVDAETLTRQVLGFPLPLTQLTDWVRGRARSGTIERDDYGRLTRLHHDAWQIEYVYENAEAQSPPMRLVAKRTNGIELRLRIDEWRSLASGGEEP